MPRDAPSMLSAEWTNRRVTNVLTRIDGILNHLLFEGLLSSGYLPLEQPIDKDLLRRLTPEQLIALIQSQATPEGRLAILQALDVPLEDVYNMLGMAPVATEESRG